MAKSLKKQRLKVIAKRAKKIPFEMSDDLEPDMGPNAEKAHKKWIRKRNKRDAEVSQLIVAATDLSKQYSQLMQMIIEMAQLCKPLLEQQINNLKKENSELI